MKNCEYFCGGAEFLDEIEPLWKKLNVLHSNVSPHFSERSATYPFTIRKQGFIEKTKQGSLRVEVAKTKANQQLIAYCVSTITQDRTGEIDTIFVEEECRGEGIADQLMRNALAWMDQEQVKAKVLVVLWGNEKVYSFYKRYGFFPLSTTLMQKQG